MIEEIVTVVGVEPSRVRVAAARNSACAQCSSRSNCSQGVLSQWQKDKVVEVEALNPSNLSVAVGERVVIGLPEGSLMRASFLLYCLPLLCLVLVAVTARQLGLGEVEQVLLSVMALLAGFWGVRRYTRRHEVQPHYQPVLLKILET